MAAYKIRTRYHYTDDAGNKVSTIPSSNQLSVSDVVGEKATWDDLDGDKSMTVAAPVTAGVQGATHIRFEEFKPTANPAAATRLNLVLGKTATELNLAADVANNTSVSAEDRMQGLDKLLIPIGTRVAFVQLA